MTSFLILIIVAFISSIWITDHKGTIAINWLNYSITVDIIFALFLITLVTLLTIIIIRTIFHFSFFINNIKIKNREKNMLIADKICMYTIHGDVKNALSCTNKLEKNKFDNKLLSLLKGRLHFKLGQYSTASKYFIILKDENIKLSEYLGLWLINTTYSQIKNQHQQLLLLESLIEIFSNQKWVSLFRIEVFRIKRKWKEAISELIHAQKIGIALPYQNPKQTLEIFYFALAQQLYDEEKYSDGLNTIKSINTYSDHTILLKAKLYNKIGKKRKSLSLLEQQYKTSPKAEIAKLYLTLYDNKESAISKIYNISPNYHFSIYLISELEIKSGNYDSAFERLSKAIEIHPDSLSLYYLIIKLKIITKDNTDASFYLDKMFKNCSLKYDWYCKNCNFFLNSWCYECQKCNYFNTIYKTEQ